jgi:hypothetical protein
VETDGGIRLNLGHVLDDLDGEPKSNFNVISATHQEIVQSAPNGTMHVVFIPILDVVVERLRDEFVAGSMEGSEMRGLRWVSLQLLPQLQNMIVHGAGTRIIFVTPDFVQKFIP